MLDQKGFYRHAEIVFDGYCPPAELDLTRCYWKIDDTKMVSFFNNEKPIPVTYVSSSDPRLSEYLEELKDNYPIAMDIEWRHDESASQDCPIGVYSFASSKGCIVVQNREFKPSRRLNEFLLDYEFIGHDMEFKHMKLEAEFGTTFTIREFGEAYNVPDDLPEDFNEMVELLHKRPKVKVVDAYTFKSNWLAPELTMKQVLYMAYKAIGLYQCYLSPKVFEFTKINRNWHRREEGTVVRSDGLPARRGA